MNELMIEAWNSKVRPNDTVYHLGDVAFGPPTKAADILNRLNGTIILIQGNHDHKLLNDHWARKRFTAVYPYLSVKVSGQDIVLFHYPIKEWDRMHRGSWHLYGHVHGKEMGLTDRKAMDAGIDSRPNADMAPWSFDEVKKVLDKREIFSHHG